MSIFSFFSNKNAWDYDKIPKVWDQKRISIYDFLISHLANQDGPLDDEESKLPDAPYLYDQDSLQWVAGGRDSCFFYHARAGNNHEIAEEIFNCLKHITQAKKPKEKEITALYDLLQRHNAIDYMFSLAKMIINNKDTIDFSKILRLALWLVYFSPDREPIKLGIFLLSLSSDSHDFIKIFLLYGLHDEFSLFSAMIIFDINENGEFYTWQAAQRVKGWGRVNFVTRLDNIVTDPKIKRWLLTDGYKNEIMHEYLAYICAVNANLLTELENADLDDDLLFGIGEILAALINGGPSKDIFDYQDGPKALTLYIENLSTVDLAIKYFSIIKTIFVFVTEGTEEFWQKLAEKGWTDKIRTNIKKQAELILSDPKWMDLMWEDLNSDKQEYFYDASEIAKHFNIDIWEYYYQRQKAYPNYAYWNRLLSLNDLNRTDNALDLAKDIIKREKNCHFVDFICQILANFPGRGYDIIQHALGSQKISDRTKALITLDKWGQENWPEGARDFLNLMLDNESEDSIKKLLKIIIEDDSFVTGKLRPGPVPLDWLGRKLKSDKKGYCWYDPNTDNNAIFLYRSYDKGDYVITVQDGVCLDQDQNPIPDSSMPED